MMLSKLGPHSSCNRWISLMMVNLTRLMYDVFLVILHVRTSYFSSIICISEIFCFVIWASLAHQGWVYQFLHYSTWQVHWEWWLWGVEWGLASRLFSECTTPSYKNLMQFFRSELKPSKALTLLTTDHNFRTSSWTFWMFTVSETVSPLAIHCETHEACFSSI